MKLKSFKNIIAYGLPIIVLIYIFLTIDLIQIIETLKNVNIFWFFISFITYVFFVFITGVRSKVIVRNFSNVLIFFFSNSIGSLARNILPSRSGEISYPLIWKKYCKVPVALGSATLITTRIFDFLILMLVYFIGFIFYYQSMPDFFQKWFFLLLIGIFILILLLILYLPRTRLWEDKIRKSLQLYSSKRNNIFRKILWWLDIILEDFGKIYSFKLYITVFFISCLIIFLRILYIYATIRCVGYVLSIEEIIVMSFLLFWTKMVQTIGNLGTKEAGIAGALILFGLAKEEAISIALSSHLLQLVPMAILSFISYIILILFYTKVKKDNTSEII